MTPITSFDEGLYASGQPTREQLAALARNGVRTVINLRAPGEPVEFDEAASASALGLDYLVLPIAGAADLDLDRVRHFGSLLTRARERGAVLIHCATSNRVGALVALDRAINHGDALDAALERGRTAGLASLEPAVVALARRR